MRNSLLQVVKMNAFIFAGCYFVGFATLVSATFGNKLNSDFRQLGISTETKASKFSGVVDSNNVHRMLRIDKFDVPPYEVSAEVETIRYLSSLKVAPGLVSNLFLPTNAKTGKRHTVTESFGQTLKQRVVTLGTLTEVEAAELTAQVARALKTLTSAGYNHNGIDYESIAFTGTEPDSDLLFDDLTEAKPARVTDATLGFLKYDLSPEKVYSRFVERDYPGTDRSWFTSKAIHDDSMIAEFLRLAWGDWPGWIAETKAAIRNSRIVAGLGTGCSCKLQTPPKNNFCGVLLNINQHAPQS